MNVLPSLLLAIGLMSLTFFIAWLWAKQIRNYSIVDAFWAYSIGFTGLIWLLLATPVSGKHLAACALLAAWSLRLGYHLHIRIAKHHPVEDARYATLRETWKGRVDAAFFWFFQAQAFSVILLALPFLVIASDPSPLWSFLHYAGFAIALIGIGGEALADWQMSNFKSGNSDPKAVCDRGLWRYSRHPNYFFESVIWFGFFIFAAGSPWGWATIHAPLIITYLLLKVTGIPPTEAAAVSRKGEAYRQYQRATSAFVPMPRKSK